MFSSLPSLIIAQSTEISSLKTLNFTNAPSRLIINKFCFTTAFFHRDPASMNIRLWRPYISKANVNIKVDGAKSISLADPYGKPVKLISNTGEGNLEISMDKIVTLSVCF
jgi:hypothetical protein